MPNQTCTWVGFDEFADVPVVMKTDSGVLGLNPDYNHPFSAQVFSSTKWNSTSQHSYEDQMKCWKHLTHETYNPADENLKWE